MYHLMRISKEGSGFKFLRNTLTIREANDWIDRQVRQGELKEDDVEIFCNLTEALEDILNKHRGWSTETFGNGERREGICKHIEKELQEIRECPDHASLLEEWIDVLILGMDGATRTGATSREIVDTLRRKMEKNRRRQWPPRESVRPDQPTEHIRG